MKGVLLHGGAGTRLRPLTFTGPKQLIPIANKPVSQYAVEDMRDAGINEIAIILGETYPELVINHYKDGSSLGVKITYITQGKPLGIAHAVSLTKEFVNGEKFVVYLGDNVLQEGIKNYAKSFQESDLDALILLKEVEDPSRFGVAEVKENKIIRVVEKPKQYISNLALVGVYFFTSSIFDAISEIKPSARGELEITDAIQKLIDKGRKVGYEVIEGWWIDTGKKDDVLTANALILDQRLRGEVQGKLINSKVEGRVKIGKGSIIENSLIRGPVAIGEDVIIENSFIGPYTSIGNGVRIANSNLEYCIVLEKVSIKDIERLEDSLIGKNAIVRKASKRILRLHVGDYSEVEV